MGLGELIGKQLNSKEQAQLQYPGPILAILFDWKVVRGGGCSCSTHRNTGNMMALAVVAIAMSI